MNKFGQLLLVCLFITFIFVIGIYKVISVDVKESEVENRKLALMPNTSLQTILNGKFMKDFEQYFTDQFPGRNVWLNAYIDYQKLTNKIFIYDYYVSDDNWILPKPEYDNYKSKINTSTGLLNEFGSYLQENGKEFYYFSAPHKVNNLGFLYPSYIEHGQYDKSLNYFASQIDEDKVKFINMSEIFSNYSKKELLSMYFKTDHHWNYKGAFEGYKIFANTLEKYSKNFSFNSNMLTPDYYNKVCVKEDQKLEGSYNRQIYMSVDETESNRMCAYTHKTFESYEITVNDNPIKWNELYGRAFHNNNKTFSYGELYTNNTGEINIINPNNKEASNILVIKDSYANPMIYQIAQLFYQTTIYDQRYNKDQSIQDYIKERDYDIVVMIYNSTHLYGENFQFKKSTN